MPAPAVIGSLALFVIVYLTLLLAFFIYFVRVVLRGPHAEPPAKQSPSVRPGLDSAPAARLLE